MNAPVAVRQLIKRVLQQVHNFKVDVIAGDARAAACKYYKKQEYRDLYNSSVAIRLREKHREVNEGRPFASRLQIDYGKIIIPCTSAPQVILIVASWPFSQGPRIMITLWSNSRERMEDYE